MEFRSVGPPCGFRTVDSPGRDVDTCSLWDGLCADGGVPDGDSHSYGDSRVEAKDLSGDGVEEGEAFENSREVNRRV